MNQLRLFSPHPISTETSGKRREVSTPLGTVRVQATIGDFRSDLVDPTVVVQLQNGSRIFSWQAQGFELELLLCNLGEHQDADAGDDAWAGIWRFAAKADTPAILFECGWTSDATWTEGCPNTGQYLLSWLWEKDNTTVAIGTKDDEWLVKRSNRGSLPRRWNVFFERTLWDQPYRYDYERNGVPVRLPAYSVKLRLWLRGQGRKGICNCGRRLNCRRRQC